MPDPRLLLPLTVLAACHSYTPAPVDLAAHAATFLARLPEPDAMAAALRVDTSPFMVDVTDGIDRREARLVAICFHPDCRSARARTAAATSAREHAGAQPDPELSFDVARILASVPHPWIAGGALAIPLPWSGRLGLAKDLAAAAVDERIGEAIAVERAAADAVDATWVRWSHERARAALLDEVCTRLQALCDVADRLAASGALMHQSARAFTLERLQRELDRDTARDAAAGLELELKQRMGLHPAAPVTLVPGLGVDPQLDTPEARAASLALSPRVLTARLAHRSAERDLELEVARQWPDLVLAPGFTEEDAQPRPGLGVVLPLPLFAGNDAGIARARAARDTAAEALRAALEVATQDLALAELHLQQVRARRQFVTEKLVPLADQQVEDGRRLAELGQLEPLLLLDALTRSRETRLQALDAALQEALAIVAVNTHSGLPGSPAAEESSR